MTFWRRLRIYLVGVGMGLVLVWIFFGRGERSSWTPEGRVLLAIDSSTQIFSERALCQMNCLQIDSSAIMEIQDHAAVNFSESNARKKPCPIYQLKSEFEQKEFQLIWKVCENDERVELMSLIEKGRTCDCN